MQDKPSVAPSWIREVLPAAALNVRPEQSVYGLWEFSLPPMRGDPTAKPVCREIHVVHSARHAGWNAYWRPGIRHASWSATWPDEVRSIRGLIKEAPSEVREALRRIRSDVKGVTRAGFGWPDLVIWHPRRDAVRFIEVKGPKEAMRQTQVLWVERAFASGAIDSSDLAIVRL